MIEHCRENLQEIKKLVHSLEQDDYIASTPFLSGASIGQHVRHILEFYLCLLEGIKTKTVNYDKRERNFDLESNPDFAVYTIDKISSNLAFAKDEAIKLEGNFTFEDGASEFIQSSVNRELAYCLEHSIHHQALIKIALKELVLEYLINDSFGVAPATIRNNALKHQKA
jgi:uncharacterized damage-inducible protein DinB